MNAEAETIERRLADPATNEAVRATMIGGSDAPLACGVSRWGGPLDVYARKLGMIDRDPGSEAAEWGTILEPVLLREMARREGVVVVGRDDNGDVVAYQPFGRPVSIEEYGDEAAERLSVAMGTLRHPEFPFLGCHLDGIVLRDAPFSTEPRAIVEAKTASAWRSGEWGDEGTDQMPEDYVVQCQHNSMIAHHALGLDAPPVVLGPTLIGGQRWKVQAVAPNRALQARIRDIEVELWTRILAHDPPPAGPGEVGKSILAALYPEDDGEERVVDIMHPLHELAVQLHDARQAAKDADAEKVRLENLIKQEMGEASALLGAGWKITWKKTRDRSDSDYRAAIHDLARRLDADPSVVDEVVRAHTTTKKGSRRFLPTFKLEA